jgi:hypothetical protein
VSDVAVYYHYMMREMREETAYNKKLVAVILLFCILLTRFALFSENSFLTISNSVSDEDKKVTSDLPLSLSEHKNIIPISFEWRDLSPKELQEWYRPVDFCMLNSSSDTMSTKDHFMSRCNGTARKGGKKLDLSFCGPGMGSRGQCPSPLASREFFFRALRGFDQAAQKPLLSLLKSLVKHDQQLIFIGDSLMRQNVLAFLCEVQRENVLVSSSHVDASCHHVYTIRGVQVLFLQVGTLHSVDNRCETNVGALDRAGPGSCAYARGVVQRAQQKVRLYRRHLMCVCVHVYV